MLHAQPRVTARSGERVLQEVVADADGLGRARLPVTFDHSESPNRSACQAAYTRAQPTSLQSMQGTFDSNPASTLVEQSSDESCHIPMPATPASLRQCSDSACGIPADTADAAKLPTGGKTAATDGMTATMGHVQLESSPIAREGVDCRLLAPAPYMTGRQVSGASAQEMSGRTTSEPQSCSLHAPHLPGTGQVAIPQPANAASSIHPQEQAARDDCGTLPRLDGAQAQECWHAVASLVRLPPRSTASRISAEAGSCAEGDWQVGQPT